MLFDNQKITVNMNGKDYLEYEKFRRENVKQMPKNIKNALPYFVISLLGIMLLIGLIFLVIPERSLSTAERFAELYLEQNQDNISWNDIGKVFAISLGPIVIILICAAWMIHGVGFHIVKR